MTTRLWMVVLASVSASFSLCAQQPGGAGVWQKFQDKLAPIADYSVTMVTLSGGNSSTSRMARLAPKMRMEMETPGMGSMAMIMDPEAANDKGGKGVSYTLFVAQKMYMKQALTPAGARTKTDADVSVEELGKDTVAGLICDKRRLTITEIATKQAHVMLLWVSSSVRNMPVQMESTEQGVTSVIQFRNYSFEKPAANLFVVPADFVVMGGGMFPGMPAGAAAPDGVSAPAAPMVTLGSPALGVTVHPGGTAVVTTNVPVAAPQDVGEAAKQAAKDTTQSAVQEGVNRGFKKVFGW